MGRARIQKELSGATPSWKRGFEQLEAFIAEHRNDADFKALQPGIAQFADQIGYGAAKTAEQVKDPELLTVSADATRRLEQFGDPQNPPTTALERTIFRAGCALWQVPRENVYGPDVYRRHLLDAGFGAVTIEHAGARTFPGYYREQRRPAFRREMVRLQGPLVGRLGHVVNVAAYKSYELGICDYELVRAERV